MSVHATTQSFKLQRLTKHSQNREHSNRSNCEQKQQKDHKDHKQNKQTFKLAAINSISRGVKYNDLTFMSGRQLNLLRKQPQIGDDIQYQCAHMNLQGCRKNYDSAHNSKHKREDSINKLKQQKKKLSFTEAQLKYKRQNGDRKVRNLHDNLQNIKLLYVQAQMQKKVLQNMRTRLKQDKVVYDQKKYDMEQYLRSIKKQKSLIKQQRNQKCLEDDRTNKVYKKYVHHLQQEQQDRDQHINHVQCMIEEKQRVSQLNQYRARELHDIAEKAMQDKDNNEKRWQKIHLANKLLTKLLKRKIEKQMQKFYIVQTAFKTIKIATGVSDAQQLIYKFLNKQTTYGQLLGKIAENQKKIEDLKLDGEQLRKQGKDLENQRDIIGSSKKTTTNVEDHYKTLVDMDKKQQRETLYREKIRNWLSKTNKKMNTILGKRYPTNIQRNLRAVTNQFIQYLKNLNAQFEQIQKEESLYEQKYKEQTLKEKKLIRIKDDHLKQKQEMQDENNNDHNEENQGVTNQRLQILRSNEKFMREVKKKHLEKQKLLVQTLKKKETV